MKIAVLPGDGIGPEIVAQAVKVLRRVAQDGIALDLVEAPVGGAGYEASGDPLPDATLALAREADAILFGLRNPKQFDVTVTGNMFADILSDEAPMLTGFIGMLPSASLDERGKGLYEPIHGSAPDIAGKNVANPLAAILSAAMMLRYSLDRDGVADRVEAAVRRVLAGRLRTADIDAPGMTRVGTDAMGDAVVAAL